MSPVLLPALLPAALLVLPLPIQEPADAPPPRFVFGVIADCQYADADSAVRRYRLSDEKLAACVADFNASELAFVVSLGDLIDREAASYDVLLPILAELRAPVHHVLGNHDFTVDEEHKLGVPARLGREERYASFRHEGWRFLVLDGNDLSTYAWPEEHPRRAVSEAAFATQPDGTPDWNGGIGEAQLAWIEAQLDAADAAAERVALFCHFPLLPEGVHNLWEAAGLRRLLADHPSVQLYANGHDHGGAYATENGIHFLTLRGMVDTEETAYARIAVYDDRLEVIGAGREPSRTLLLRPRAATRADGE